MERKYLYMLVDYRTGCPVSRHVSIEAARAALARHNRTPFAKPRMIHEYSNIIWSAARRDWTVR